jgi:hypothetical protein
LAVNKHYQSTGIGKDLVKKARNVIGEKVALILLSGMGTNPKLDSNPHQQRFHNKTQVLTVIAPSYLPNRHSDTVYQIDAPNWQDSAFKALIRIHREPLLSSSRHALTAK